MTVAMLAADHWDGWHRHGWGGPPWPFFAFVLVVVIAIALFAWSRRHTHHGGAQAVLAERYARGEIDAAEYRERLAELRRRS